VQMLIVCCKMNIKRPRHAVPCNYRSTDRRERERERERGGGEVSSAVTMTGQMSEEAVTCK